MVHVESNVAEGTIVWSVSAHFGASVELGVGLDAGSVFQEFKSPRTKHAFSGLQGLVRRADKKVVIAHAFIAFD